MKRAQELPGLSRGRILEPEVMDEASEVKAYLDGVATAHLDRMDDTFVAGALAKIKRIRTAPPPATRRSIHVLDVGTGTGAIPVKMAQRDPGLLIVGVDGAGNMLKEARARARGAALSDRVTFRRADGRRLPFPDRAFDLVISNSVMHHLPDPAPALDEVARVLKHGGALFIRDLRRPARRAIERHIRRHGRFYRGTMLRLFSDSVRAAFTESELKEIVGRCRLARLPRLRVRRQFETYLVVEAPAP
jgi:ubiquinone/menaquinone biosynthesis C-methylase UbiE